MVSVHRWRPSSARWTGDIRIASTEAYFGLFEVKRGIMPGYAIHHLARMLPIGDALYIMLTADRISPEDALRMGLIREILEPDALFAPGS